MRRVGIIALAPYLVLSNSAFPLAADCSDLSSKTHLLIAEAKTSNDTTPAMSGVKLLHQIFLALRGSNQLALNNPTKQLAAATQAFQGSLNPLLAIRPSEKSFNRTAPAIAMAQQDKRLYVNRSIVANESGPGSDVKEYGKKRIASNAAAFQMNSPVSAPAPVPQNPASAGNSPRTTACYSSQSPEIHDARISAKSKPPDARFEFQPNTYALTTSPRSRIASQNNLANNMKMSQQNSKMLTQSVSKLMQSTKQLSELSQVNENSVRSYGQAKRELRDERIVATLPGGPVIQEYSGAPAKVSGSKDLMSAEPQVRNADSDSSDAALDAPLMAPDQPGQYRTLRNQLIAMLPPSVVSGIPLARLGATEQELSATLSKKNNVSKQKIEDWTVWTVRAENSRSCAVQLYMRHAVVEAIRVFQPAYLGEEVGIKIGDDLPTIKVKFGEPALILPEPDVPGNHSASKNYVYPISHVAFQLARSKSQPSPQVISVLIFDVQ